MPIPDFVSLHPGYYEAAKREGNKGSGTPVGQ
jgi:hypothetical protein